MIGGSSLAAAQRAGRLGDGFYPIAPTLDGLKLQIDAMRSAADAAGRDPGTIEISTLAFALVGEDPVTEELREMFDGMERIGISRVVIPRLLDADREHVLHSLQRLAADLIERPAVTASAT